MFFSDHYFESAYVQLIDLFYKFVVLKFNGDIELNVGLKELKKSSSYLDFNGRSSSGWSNGNVIK